MNEQERMLALVARLNDASESYYNGGEEKMSNTEWDRLFDELTAMELRTGIILENSPTQTVGAGKQTLFGNRERHEFPALSLQKTKIVEELQKWAGDLDVWLSWKYDGITLVLTYDQGVLQKILTRGDAFYGTNITDLKTAIKGFPETIDYEGHLVVRGEAVITYSDFEAINLESEDDRTYANPRNLVSGTLALDDLEKVKTRKVAFKAFTLVYADTPMNAWGERMDFLDHLHFDTADREKTNAEGLPEVVARWTRRVEKGEMGIPVDGLVICYDDVDYAADGSVTNHHATRAGLAFKWQDTVAETVLDHIEWSCAASVITPVAVFDPVYLEGTEVKRASLCNITELKRLGIGANRETKLSVVKANMIIPKIIAADGHGTSFDVPTICPVCGAPTMLKQGNNSQTETLHCTNHACPAKNLRKFTRFVSRSGMDIDGLSARTLNRFINLGYIQSFSDIFSLGQYADAIRKMEGFGEKSLSNLLNAIEKSRRVDAVHFIVSLCIPLVGVDAAKKLVRTIGMDGFLRRLERDEGYEDIDGLGPERSGAIRAWYRGETVVELKKLLDEVTILNGDKAENTAGACAGLTFVITGKTEIFKNRDAFTAYVESQKGKVSGSISGKTHYLVNNDSASASAKNKKAKALNIPVITEMEFVAQFGFEGDKDHTAKE